MPEQTPEACAQAQLDAYNARDIAAFADAYSDDVQLIDLATNTVFCQNKQHLINRYGPMFAEHPDLHCELVHRITAPPFVIDEERVRGLRPGVVVHAVATYEVHNGVIRRGWFLREEEG